MGMHVEIVNYDSGNYESEQSKHTYIRHEITTTVTDQEGGYYGSRPEMGINRFYEDEETGILTRDVGRYESFLRKIGAI